ncbi:DUF6216 family protein [Variovorax sp. OV329]|uniref:DUF6216 family protein n=1 Tax=Variovorax sp. OV329 TaxID=1882825 RepID=UPI0008DFA9B1|nr:DUF6216 family protein [Variovorax sp. OV329]SFN47828.1 hypothetical protein SAMN05444747_12910 [Variovorax sp. OV329]
MNSGSVSTFSSLAPLLIALVPLVAFGLVWWRTGSLYLPLNRLWQLIYGGQDVQDSEIKALIAQQNDRMRFRLAFRIPVASMAQLRKLQAWAGAHRLEMHEIGECGPFFLVGDLKVKLPSAWRVVPQVALVLVLFLPLPILPWLLVQDQVLVNLRESGRSFLLDESTARPVFPLGPQLSKAACAARNGLQDDRGFSPVERDILCKVFIGDGTDDGRTKAATELTNFIQDALTSQRWSLAALGAILAMSVTAIWLWLRAFSAAKDLQRRLRAFSNERAEAGCR